MISSYIVVVLALCCFHGCEAVFNLRRLIGSNCILIERGEVPPYYDCVGCIIEQAQGCLSDMRANKSENVGASCAMYSASEVYDGTDCCPRFTTFIKTGLDLMYVGSAYPEALRCIEKAGCKSSVIYTQLMEECTSVCPYSDPRDSSLSVCLSDFNGASSLRISIIFTVLCSIIALLLMGMFS